MEVELLSMGDGVVSSFNPMESGDVVDCALEMVVEPCGAIVVSAPDEGVEELLSVAVIPTFESSIGLSVLEDAAVAIVSDGSASNESSGATDPSTACVGVAFVIPLVADVVAIPSRGA